MHVACEGGLGGVRSQLREEAEPGPRLPSGQTLRAGFSGQLTEGDRGKMRRLKRTKFLLRASEREAS